jgi:hypothetical protein
MKLNRRAVSLALDVVGLGFLVVAGWEWTPIAGLVVAGVGLFALSWGVSE